MTWIRRPLISICKNQKKMKKIFLYKILCHHYHTHKKKILCVIFIKITACFLPEGRTSHSQFEILIEHDKHSIFAIKKNNSRGRFFAEIDLIVWNKIFMQHIHCFEIVNRLFKNLRFDSDESVKFRPLFDEIRVAARCGDTDGVSVRCGVHFFDTDGVHDTVGVFT